MHTLPHAIQALAHRKLLMIDAAQWSIRINAQWRICFHFVGEDALNVQIVDYH